VTQARDELADLVSRVAYGHERIVLTRHSKPVACLVSPEDLARLEELEEVQREAHSGAYPAGPVPATPARPPGTPGPLPVAAAYREPGPGGQGSPAQPG
jgi:prevent-host-death family protein